MVLSGSEHPLLAHARERADALAGVLARRAYESGLAVTRADGSLRPIAIGALPVILEDAEVARRAAVAGCLLSAIAKVARWRMSGADHAAVMSALGASEQRLLQATWNGSQVVAVARVDCFPGVRLQALEINATIPAMQGYSDIAAESWLQTFAEGRSDLPALRAANGSNAEALLRALGGLHARMRDGQVPERIGLLCRRGDSQLSELAYLRDRFRAAGVEADVLHPDELQRQGAWLTHGGRRLSLLYRHVFLSRLDAMPSPELESAMLASSGAGTLVLNRPTPHLEMKSTLARLSEAQEDAALADAIGLEAGELAAVAAGLPWTRCLRSDTLEGRQVLAEVSARPQDYVLKRSWSYGGLDVFVGRGAASASFWSRVQASFPGTDSWPELCRRASVDNRGGGFVVQRAVPSESTFQILCEPEANTAASVITDYAAYASLGVEAGWSGVCRAATSDVVNIVGGGAVVPILRKSVADRLLQDPA